MFNEINIVQSALSAFNNAALSAPAFFWCAVLSAPIFIIAYMYGNTLIEKLGWNKGQLIRTTSVWTICLTLLWIILFSGNYAVLRDATLLPFVIASIIFASALFIGNYSRDLQMPKSRNARRVGAIIAGLFLFLVVLSDTHTWWAPLLQLGALIVGFVIGRRSHKNLPHTVPALVIMLGTVIAILMQPEFFRFGQLGNLSPIHLICVMFFGLCIVATLATRYITPKSRIRQSAYIKLKWMARVLTTLGFAMFIITESVPMFVGTIIMAYIMFGLSINHAKTISSDISDIMFTLSVFMFGMITTMPVISCLGILTFINLPHAQTWPNAKFLL